VHNDSHVVSIDNLVALEKLYIDVLVESNDTQLHDPADGWNWQEC